MNRQDILTLLSGNYRYMQKNFSVRKISIFGSVARNESTQKSDIDILVEFAGKATFDNFMNLKFYLQDLLNAGVDLVTKKAIRPQIKKEIEREIIDVPR